MRKWMVILDGQMTTQMYKYEDYDEAFRFYNFHRRKDKEDWNFVSIYLVEIKEVEHIVDLED